MSIINRILILALMIGIGIIIGPVHAVTPEAQDHLRIHTGTPKKTGESIISITGLWRIDQNLRYESTGLSFVHGPGQPKSDDAVSVAKKMNQALKEAMMKQIPSWRGINASYDESPEDPQFIMKNNQGYSFNQITIRDYTNEKFTAEIGGQSFFADGVKVAIDLVEAAAIDEVSMFGAPASNTSDFRAEGGGIEATIGDRTAQIDTTDKTTAEIEKALASTLGGSFGSTPIYPHTESGDARNLKPFDGGEAQFTRLSAKSFTIDIKDPSLAVITKYKFKDDNISSADSLGPFIPYIFVAIALAGGAYYYREVLKKKPSEGGDQG